MAKDPVMLGAVQAGEYSNRPIYSSKDLRLSKDEYLVICEKLVKFDKFTPDVPIVLKNIAPDTVARFNVIEQQTVSGRSGNVLGATLLYGLAGTIAASQQVTETLYTIAVDFKDGRSCLLKLFSRAYNTFVNTVSYAIYKSQQLSIPEQIKQLKQLLDSGKITQAEFEIRKRQLL